MSAPQYSEVWPHEKHLERGSYLAPYTLKVVTLQNTFLPSVHSYANNMCRPLVTPEEGHFSLDRSFRAHCPSAYEVCKPHMHIKVISILGLVREEKKGSIWDGKLCVYILLSCKEFLEIFHSSSVTFRDIFWKQLFISVSSLLWPTVRTFWQTKAS